MKGEQGNSRLDQGVDIGFVDVEGLWKDFILLPLDLSFLTYASFCIILYPGIAGGRGDC